MVASTVYSDSQTVIVDTGVTPTSAPWLARTTYLLDESGHTTAVLAQTDQPTVDVTNTPVPYTAPAHTALPTLKEVALPSGWAYSGCYNDQVPYRPLALALQELSNLTVQVCVWLCYEHSYTISGVENRNLCFCGNSIDYGGTRSEWESDCNLSCSGDETEICGGYNMMSIFSNGTLPTYPLSAAQTSVLTTAAPSILPLPTVATSRMTVPGTTIAAAVIGTVAGIAIMAALTIYLRRRTKRNRLRMESQVQTLRPTSRKRLPADPVASWEEAMKDTERYYAGSDESTIFYHQRNGSGLGLNITHVDDRPDIPEMRGRYSPPQRPPARAQLDQPTSILKRPTATGTTEQSHKGGAATKNIARAKKGVRFGVNQIREFGRSPFLGHGSET